MKLHLPLHLFLSVTALYAGVQAESVSVSSWDDISNALTAGNQEMIMGQDITAGSSTLLPGSATVIDGNGHSLIMSPESEGQTTKPLFEVTENKDLTWKNISVKGVINPSSELSSLRGGLIAMRNPGKGGKVTLDSCSITGIRIGNGGYKALIYLDNNRSGSTVNFTNGTFTDNEAIIAEISGQIQGEINNCSFERNGSALSRNGGALVLSAPSTFVVKNTTLAKNYAQGSSEIEAKGGAVYALKHFNMESCEFRGNYVLSGGIKPGESDGKGGAIYLTEADSSNSVSFSIAAKDRDCVFEGNRMGVTSVGADGKLEGGVANSIYVEDVYNRTESTKFKIQADEGKSVKFYDPIVVNDVGLGKPQSSLNVKYIGIMLLNAYDSLADENLSRCKGSIVFSGEKYTNDTDRMSRLTMAMAMAQDNGRVVITKGACVGANMTSGSIADAKKGRIENAGYNLAKGTLSITEEGSLITGGFMVGVGGETSSNHGWDNCVLSVGASASLTTGWVRIDQGVSFDLLSFFNGGQMGLTIDLATEYMTFSYVYDWSREGFTQSSAGRFVLGGTLGLSDSLDMYRNEMWKTEQSFLLMDLTKSAADAYTASGSTNFGKIVSNTTGESRVEGESVYNGTWSQKWVDDGKGGKQLYAVWAADGNTPTIPEPTTATLSLLGLALLTFRRRR